MHLSTLIYHIKRWYDYKTKAINYDTIITPAVIQSMVSSDLDNYDTATPALSSQLYTAPFLRFPFSQKLTIPPKL